MREIKFRQAIFKDGKFHHWHYWGYVGHMKSFVAPIEISQDSRDKTYEVKDSQEYIGLHSGKLGLGSRIYEGDILPPVDHLSRRVNQLVQYCAEVGCAGFITSDGLQFDECGEVIGNNYETPELLEKP